jgi:hypothetical protein
MYRIVTTNSDVKTNVQENVTTATWHGLDIIPAEPHCKGNGLCFLPIHSNSQRNTNNDKTHSRQDSKRIMFPGTLFT